MSKSKVQKVPQVQNFVHKHMETFNKPQTHIDRKKELKKSGSTKHKGKHFDE